MYINILLKKFLNSIFIFYLFLFFIFYFLFFIYFKKKIHFWIDTYMKIES
jgi:hypothetical protein